MLTSLGTVHGCFQQGETYELADALGASFCLGRIAVRTTEPPEIYTRFMARLDDGAGEPCLFLPFVGEFGHLVMTHIRLVHWHKAAHKAVACRDHERVLFPSANEFVTDWIDPVPDAKRIASHRSERLVWPHITARYPNHKVIEAGNLTPTQELIAIHPTERIPFRPRLRGLHVDVVLGVRQRAFEAVRNWRHWTLVADALKIHGYTFAVMGHLDTSCHLVGESFHTGDMDTDAAVEALTSCHLYVGNDSGGSHLASTVGAPMLIFRETASGSRDLTPRMDKVNTGRVEVLPPTAWNQPQQVIETILERLGNGVHTANEVHHA